MNFRTRLPILAAALSLAFAPAPHAHAAPGDLDTGFDPDANSLVYSTAVQADGKVIIGGLFTSVGGTPRNRIARLNADGSLDTTFDPGAGADGLVVSTALQADGKVIIGGLFTSVGGTPRNRIARLNADGTLDTSFDPGTGADDDVFSTALQADGKVIIAGDFTTVGGTARNYIARLNAGGTLDTSFDPGTGANNDVYSTAVQADGKVIIGGFFTSVGGTPRNYIARLNAGGTLDTSFDPGTGANADVFSTAVQADGKVIIAGDFTTVGGTARNRIARLNAGGTLDTSFDPGTGANNGVYSTAVQADGKVIIAGDFTTVGGTARNRIARLNAGGTLDTSFDPGTGANADVTSTAVQADGKVIIGGFFTSVGGTPRNRIARLENGAATGSLTVPSLSKVKWLRGGTAPEATRVTFEYKKGSTWKSLGAGTRISGGWQITGVTIPAKANIRARAYTSGGNFNASSGIIEAFATAPAAGLKDTWTSWYNSASYYYGLYASFGDYNNAAAFYYYYYGVGDYYYHLARKNQGPADFALYNGLALFYLYAYSSTSSYYYYLALAYYYYFAGFGDFTNAVNYYYAYIAYAG